MTELTIQQQHDIDIIKPWAMTSLSKKYDGVLFLRVINNINVYQLYKTEWGCHHKVGMPILAIVVNDIPHLLNDDDVMTVLIS